MKLELKHITPYIHHKIKALYYDEICEITGVYTNVIDGNMNLQGKFNDGQVDVIHHSNFKLLLRPLSDLTKEIEHNGDVIYTVKHMSVYSRQQTNDFTNGLEWAIIKTFPYSDFEYLFKMHFDVFGLINKGLAIDINTLNR